MNGKSVEQEMINIAKDLQNDIIDDLSTLEPKQTTAKKAYNISAAVINQAIKLVSMRFSNQSHDELYYNTREKRVFNAPAKMYFAEYRSWYESNPSRDLKEAFLVYAHAIQMVKTAFIDKNINELKLAKQYNETEKVFETSMVIDSLQQLIQKWEQWWIANGGIDF